MLFNLRLLHGNRFCAAVDSDVRLYVTCSRQKLDHFTSFLASLSRNSLSKALSRNWTKSVWQTNGVCLSPQTFIQISFSFILNDQLRRHYRYRQIKYYKIVYCIGEPVKYGSKIIIQPPMVPFRLSND